MMMLRFVLTWNLRAFEEKSDCAVTIWEMTEEVMNFQTALLDVRRMDEADRLTMAAGTPATELMPAGPSRAILGSAGQRVRSPCCVDQATMAATVSWLPGTLTKPAGPSALPCSGRL